MLSLSEIKKSYPEFLQAQPEFLLREYLQCKILELMYRGKFAHRYAFIGGTCLRLVHNTQRFSEDLDFDNSGIARDEFDELTDLIVKGLELQGYQVEPRNVQRGGFRCYLKFPGLLHTLGLSGHKTAKVLINLDTQDQQFQFEPEHVVLNRFDVYTTIRTTPVDILLSQKILTIAQRPRPKGRDFYDILFLIGRTTPNYRFLEAKLGVRTQKDLKEFILSLCNTFDFEQLVRDVRRFLFYPEDAKQILQFKERIESADLKNQ